MYELVQISENCFYIQSPAKIGVVKLSEGEVCLIDSGNDKEAGKKALRILEQNGWTLKAIYNTHSNADHIGGNKYLQSKTGCSVYAPEIECCFTRRPILEPAFLYGGYPPKELRHKFLMAQPSDAQLLTAKALPSGFEIIELPGHFFDMVGFRTPDDVVFLADCLSSRETLDKYRVGFIYDVAAYLETLEKVKTLRAASFVPAHAPVSADISQLAQYNIDTVYEVADKILGLCSDERSFEDILAGIFSAYALSVSFEQHALVGSTVRSYLSWLSDAGRLSRSFKDNRLLWRRV